MGEITDHTKFHLRLAGRDSNNFTIQLDIGGGYRERYIFLDKFVLIEGDDLSYYLFPLA